LARNTGRSFVITSSPKAHPEQTVSLRAIKGTTLTTVNPEIGGIMSKGSIGIAAFVLGFFCSALFSLPQSEHTSSSSRLIQNWPDKHTIRFEGGGMTGGGMGMIDPAQLGAIPFFNSLNHMPVFKKFAFVSSRQPLDGLNCEECEFKDAKLRYEGGVVNLQGSTFTGTTELQLEGAAANTIALLEFFKAIPAGKLTYKLPINKPITRKFQSALPPVPPKPPFNPTPAKQPQKMDFTAPYIGPR
jgi:hypothetical protein